VSEDLVEERVSDDESISATGGSCAWQKHLTLVSWAQYTGTQISLKYEGPVPRMQLKVIIAVFYSICCVTGTLLRTLSSSITACPLVFSGDKLQLGGDVYQLLLKILYAVHIVD